MSHSQIMNAIQGKSACNNGLNVPEIRTLLISNGFPGTGSREDLEIRLKTMIESQTSIQQKIMPQPPKTVLPTQPPKIVLPTLPQKIVLPQPPKIVLPQSTEFNVGPFHIFKIDEPGYLITGPTVDHITFLKAHGCTFHNGSWFVPQSKYDVIIAALIQSVKQIPQDQEHKYYKLEDIMIGLGVSDVAQLVDLTDAELDSVLKLIYLDKSYKVSLYSTVEKDTKNVKVESLIRTLSGKICRCIAGLMAKNAMNESTATPICIESIFTNRNLKYSGHRCNKNSYDRQEDLLMPGPDKMLLRKK